MGLLEEFRASGEIPSDPEILAQLHAELEAESGGNLDKQAETTVETTEGAATGATDKKVDETQPDGILSKDGKHVIPYDALVSERETARLAKLEAQEYKTELERLRTSGVKDVATLPSDFSTEYMRMTQEEKEEMESGWPEKLAGIKADHERLVASQLRLQEVDQREAKRQADEQQAVANSVQVDIDNNPQLHHWQTKDPVKWGVAVSMDDQLRKTDPDYLKLSRPEQFAKVARAMTAIYGDPVKSATATETTQKTTAKPVVDEKPPITSLSELSGGIAAEATLRERTENMSQAELINNLMSMSPDQRAAFMAQYTG